MKLKDILKKEAVTGSLAAMDKKTALEELAALASKVHSEISADQVLQVLLEREKLGSTGVGSGVAIPHGKLAAIQSIFAVFARSKKGIDFQAHDHKSAHLFFVLLAPENVVGNHLQALARLSRLLKSETVRARLLEARDDALYDVLIAEDDKL